MSIEKALKAIQRGDRKTAVTELNKAKKMVAEIDLAISKLVKPKFANDRCPIMGSPINPDKVAKDLIRDYKGQKVAFCCKGCPAQWDKLSDTPKAAKLAKAQPAAQKVWTCSMHPQITKDQNVPCDLGEILLNCRDMCLAEQVESLMSETVQHSDEEIIDDATILAFEVLPKPVS